MQNRNNENMNQDLFVETFVSQLQSPSNCYSCLESNISNLNSSSIITTHHDGDEDGENQDDGEARKNTTKMHRQRQRLRQRLRQRQQRRMATKSHWMEIQFGNENNPDLTATTSTFTGATNTATTTKTQQNISPSHNGLKIKVHRLTYVEYEDSVRNSGSGSGNGGVTSLQQTVENKSRRIKHNQHDDTHHHRQDRQCLAHSFLPLNDINSRSNNTDIDIDIGINTDSDTDSFFFLEVFALKANPMSSLSMDDARSSNISSLGTSGGTSATFDASHNVSSSATTHDKKQDDSTVMSTSDTNAFFLVLRGHLPLSDESVMQNCGNLNDNDNKNNENDENGNSDADKRDEGAKGDKVDGGVSSHKKRRSKGKKRLCNFTSTISIPYKPVLVKLFRLGFSSSDFNADNNHGGNGTGDIHNNGKMMENLPVGLYVAYDTTVKCYQISKEIPKQRKKNSNLNADMDTSTIHKTQGANESTKHYPRRVGNLIIKERKLLITPEFSSLSSSLLLSLLSPSSLQLASLKTKSTSAHEDFVSSLLQQSPSNQPAATPSSLSSSSCVNNPLYFSGPVTAVDTIQVKEKNKGGGGDTIMHYVALGCKNGVIRIISYSNSLSNEETLVQVHDSHHQRSEDHDNHSDSDSIKSNSVLNVFHISEFLVDGSVLVINFNIIPKKNCMSLIVGSSCGFACSFHKVLEKDETFQQHDPQMIVQGLWNVKKKHEDHILSVCMFTCQNIYVGSSGEAEAIAIGTLSGRILLFARQANFCQTGTSSEYKCIWHVRLYYPIHSITHNLDEYGLSSLVVVTQKTIHLFNINVNSQVKKVKQRLNDLIHHHYQHG